MIKWNCNFQIPNSTVQLAIVFIKINTFENAGNECNIVLSFEDEQFNKIKDESLTIAGNYNTLSEIYIQLLGVYPNSEIY